MTRAWVQLTMLLIILLNSLNMNCPQYTSWGFAEKSVLDCELRLCRCGSRCLLAVACWDFQICQDRFLSRRQNRSEDSSTEHCVDTHVKNKNGKVFLTQCPSQWYATVLYNEISDDTQDNLVASSSAVTWLPIVKQWLLHFNRLNLLMRCWLQASTIIFCHSPWLFQPRLATRSRSLQQHLLLGLRFERHIFAWTCTVLRCDLF